MELISIIVPVYNVEKYLEKCVMSILNQTYRDIEIILVDDGSTDQCSSICDNLKQKHSNIRVIHKKNGGLSSARNVGLEVASGKFIGFVDSDDYIAPSMFEKLYQALIANSADLAICGVNMVDEEGKSLNTPDVEDSVFSNDYLYRKALDNHGWMYVTAWNRLYRRELFDKLRFREGKNNEDIFLAPYLYAKCNRIVSIKDHLYNYLQRKGSIMHGKYVAKSLNQVEAYYDNFCYLMLNEFPHELVDRAAKQTVYVYAINRWRVFMSPSKEKEYVMYIDNCFKKVYRFYKKNMFLRFVFCAMPILYSILKTARIKFIDIIFRQ